MKRAPLPIAATAASAIAAAAMWTIGGIGAASFTAAVSPSAFAAEIFPAAEWATARPAELGWDETKLKLASDYAFATDRRFVTDSLAIVHRGKLIFERYANGYTPEMRHLGWSATKSVAVALFGIAEGQGKISRHDPVKKWFPDTRMPSAWEDVTLAHLASMTNGVAWDESYEAGPLRSNIVAELYHPRYMRDMGGYRLRQSKRVAPIGTRYNYSSGDTNLLMKALKKALGSQEAYDAFPWTQLFDPIGAKSFTVMQDNDGTFVGSSYSMATPRDYLRFGYLFLRNGKWAGKTVVPEEWVRLARTPVPAFSDLRLDHRPMRAYGWGWWLNTPVPTAQIGKALANAPADAYWAQGHHGQFIFVVPSLDLVMVRFGVDKKGDLDENKLVGLILDAYPPSSAGKKGAAK